MKKYENPEMEFIRFAMTQNVLTDSIGEGDNLIDGGLDGDGGSTGIDGVL